MSFYSYFAYYYHYYYYFFIIIIIFSSLKISIPVEQLWSPCLFHILPIPLFFVTKQNFPSVRLAKPSDLVCNATCWKKTITVLKHVLHCFSILGLIFYTVCVIQLYQNLKRFTGCWVNTRTDEFYVHVTVHCNKFLYNKTN